MGSNANIDDEIEKFRVSLIQRGKGEKEESARIQQDAAKHGVRVEGVQDAAANFIQTRLKIKRGKGDKLDETRFGSPQVHAAEGNMEAASAMQTVWRLHLWRKRAENASKEMNEMVNTAQFLRSGTYKRNKLN